MNDSQLREIVGKTLKEADIDRDGKLSLEEFASVRINFIYNSVFSIISLPSIFNA